MAMTLRRRSLRTPSMVNLAVGLGLVLVIVPLALQAHQPPAPDIAEFAPEANQIKQQPSQQAGDIGQKVGNGQGKAGAGASGGAGLTGGAAPTPVAGKSPTPVSYHCFGDHQTYDPQSPPCVPFYDGPKVTDTSKGIVGGTINVVVPDTQTDYQLFQQFFNTNFNFYGRQIKLIPETPSVTFNNQPADPAGAMQQDADTYDTRDHAFASLQYTDLGNAYEAEDDIYYDELARRGIISVDARATMTTEAHRQQFAPYEWSWLPGEDIMVANKAQWVCSGLNGHPASHAGGTELNKPRVFGMVWNLTKNGRQPDVSQAISILQGCGALPTDPNKLAQVAFGCQEDLQPSIACTQKLQGAGVTSVLYEANDSAMALQRAAAGNHYFPEWIMGSYVLQDQPTHARIDDSSGEEDQQAFGISWYNKEVDNSLMPWYQALKSQQPSINIQPLDAEAMIGIYLPLLELASGIQMAGPNLTPQTFADGLHKTVFPDPNAGEAPLWQSKIGFNGKTYEVNDGVIVWWSSSSQSPYGDGTGTFCYGRHGRRYGLTTAAWPRDDGGVDTVGQCQ